MRECAGTTNGQTVLHHALEIDRFRKNRSEFLAPPSPSASGVGTPEVLSSAGRSRRPSHDVSALIEVDAYERRG